MFLRFAILAGGGVLTEADTGDTGGHAARLPGHHPDTAMRYGSRAPRKALHLSRAQTDAGLSGSAFLLSVHAYTAAGEIVSICAATPRNAQSRFTRRMDSVVLQRVSRSCGLQRSMLKHRARESATLNRLRSNKNSMPRAMCASCGVQQLFNAQPLLVALRHRPFRFGAYRYGAARKKAGFMQMRDPPRPTSGCSLAGRRKSHSR
jgi:hypothetical protein